jgi:predicted ribosomally synthesized peptide with nif11-like leader
LSEARSKRTGKGQKVSIEDVSEFFSMLDQDEALQQEYATVTEEAVRKALSDAAIGIASKHGCEFTREDLERHVESLSGELSDRDLDQVAGGAVSARAPSAGRFSLNFARFMRSGSGMYGLGSNRGTRMPSPRWGGDGGEPS